MIRILIVFFMLLGIANSVEFTYPDFSQCYKKNTKSIVYFGDIRAIAVTKNLAIAYSKTKPKVAFVKFDPFLNLYLFQSKANLEPVKFRSTQRLKLGEWIAGMDESSLYIGNFAKSEDLLNSLYLQNAKLEQNSIISCLCCEVYGLGIGDSSFIGSEYIQRFINSKDVFYGDIGARFVKLNKDFVVQSVDPLYTQNSLHVNDKILKINGKKINSLKQLNQTILFSKPKTILVLEVKRDNKILNQKMAVQSRSGGGNLSDSFLEKEGIFFDKEMKINKIGEKSFAEMSGLKIGDKLIQIDKKMIKTQNDIQEYLSKVEDKEVQLLFDRNDFQFFVKLGLQ